MYLGIHSERTGLGVSFLLLTDIPKWLVFRSLGALPASLSPMALAVSRGRMLHMRVGVAGRHLEQRSLLQDVCLSVPSYQEGKNKHLERKKIRDSCAPNRRT